MSVESAKAFCVRMMSDEAFRNKLGTENTAEAIATYIKSEGYSFAKHDLLKVIAELTGKKVEIQELSAMVCELYREEIQQKGQGSTDAVAAWLESLD